MAEANTRTDPLIAETEQAAAEKSGGRAMTAANLFDLRRIIGGLFSFYGIVLIIVGLTDSHKEIARAAGVRINLWAGLGMLALGILFLIWAFARPLGEQLEEAEAEEGGGGSTGPATPRATDPGSRDGAGAVSTDQRGRRSGSDAPHPGGGPRTGPE